MRKHPVLFCLAIVIAAVLLFGFIVLSHKKVVANYETQELLVIGEKSCFHSTEYTILSSFSSKTSSEFTLWWKHVPYPVGSLTTATLKSFGFSVAYNVPSRRIHGQLMAHKGKTTFPRVSIVQAEDGLFDLSFNNKDNASDSYPVGISYKGGPEMSLPMTQKQIESVFGKPDSVSERSSLVPYIALARYR